jgi:hypothetical protein
MNHRNTLRHIAAILLAVLSGWASMTWAQTADDPEAAALAVMDAFLVAFNARDEAAWADTLHFPHVRLASQTVTVYPDRETFLEAMDMDVFAAAYGWQYSTWDDMSVIQSSDRKVHVQVVFSRFNADDELLASFDSLYVIELVDGRWGVRGRSSFAP